MKSRTRRRSSETGIVLSLLANVGLLVPAMLSATAPPNPAPGGAETDPAPAAVWSAAGPADARFAPYAPDLDHPWNRLHRDLFVRELTNRTRVVHATDPLLYRGGTFLLAGESHQRAIALLDQFLAGRSDRLIDDPRKRLFFQHDLWAAFDYAAWVHDDWVLLSRYEPAAIALRDRLAKVISRLALEDRELAALPDNYALAVKSGQYPAAYDAAQPARAFLPPDLFDSAGPWVRFHEVTNQPMARHHFEGAGGRAVHVTFLRLPGGRAATEQYLRELRPQEPFLKEPSRHSVKQFPAGTMVAMVRRALTVDRSARLCVTPVTESVQIRVYRRIPKDATANYHGDFGEQDVCEFVLDRAKWFGGEPGLRAVAPDEPAAPFFERDEGADPFERTLRPLTPEMPQLKTCRECHQAPGVYSLLSMDRGLRAKSANHEVFRTYAWDVEMGYTVAAKTARFEWGLLRGKME
jgi:hypothetical protein